MNQEDEEPAISLRLDDFRHVTAAEGYIELGMYTEADAELEQIDPLCQVLSPVLALKLCVYAGLGKWATMEAVARKMAQHFPHDVQWRIWWATAARQLQSIESAKRILLDGLETHPNDPNIHYNLSCYESRLHHFRQAQRHLARAIQLDARFQLIAVKDQDLKPLWQELAESPMADVLDADSRC